MITLTSDRPGGFTTPELGYVYEILAQLGRLYELHNMRRTAVTLLDTYLGRHAGERVLTGSIKRGDGEKIEAVIWFCDLRGSTPLAQSMSQENFLGALNQFFDCMAGSVLEHGGQVLRFIGDAALAIFRSPQMPTRIWKHPRRRSLPPSRPTAASRWRTRSASARAGCPSTTVSACT